MTRFEGLLIVSMVLGPWCSAGCGAIMNPTRLAPPARVHAQGLGIHVAEVHVSAEIRSEDFSEASRVLVVLDLIADADMQLELKDARLSLAGAAAPAVERSALATGVGQPPQRLDDDEFAPILQLTRGRHVRAWAAFGNFPARSSREIPERVVLHMPTGQELVLSEPGQTPLWHGKAQTASFGNALWLQLSADEGALNLTFNDNRVVAGPLVVGYRSGIGMRNPIYKNGRVGGETLVCCNLAVAVDVAWPIWPEASVRLAPFLGVETAFMLGDHDITRRHWIGPSLGLELSAPLPVPHHGPFPITYPRSLLSAAYLRLALVHWFGPDRSLPSFGMVLSTGLALGY